MRVLGLISGTSFDAIEVAAADLTAEGEELTLRPLGGLSVPYAPDLARAIAAALPPAATTAEVICSLGSDRPSVVDLLATLTHLTATTVTRAIAPYGVDEVIASGDGTANPSLMADLAAELRRSTGARLRSIEEFGIPPGANEAYAFTVLGRATTHGLPGTVASCTGASGPRVLGSVVPGAGGRLPAPSPPPAPPRRLRIVTDRP